MNQSKIIFTIEEIIGTKVISRSNEDEPLKVGTFMGQMAPHNIPVVKDENGKDWMDMSIIIPYSDEMFNMLSAMTYQEQYLLLANLRNCFSLLQVGKKHSIRFANF